MQQSLFNVHVPLPDQAGVFVMNTFTDAQVIVPVAVGRWLEDLGLEGPGGGPPDLGADARETLRELADNGFIVADRAEERRAVEAYFREVRESTDMFRVTVLTTLQCNFACGYCYQGDHGVHDRFAEKMTLATAARVADWIERRMDEIAPARFSMMFFGGEPLLNVPVIDYLAARLHAASRGRDIPMSFTIVTNGLLLTRELVERLVPLGLSGIKVTLDGDRDAHNRLRPLRGGQGTFDKIVARIREVADLCPIGIGGNFDEESVASYPALLEFLSQQDFAPHLAKVVFKPIIRDTPQEPSAQRKQSARIPGGIIPLTPVSANGEKPLNGTCMTVAGTGATSACDACGLLDEKMSFLREETRRHGFPTTDHVHMGPCEIHREHSPTIGPDGSLYACPGFTGDKAQSVGHIDGRQDPVRARAASAFERLSAWKACHDCAFIPVCAGGCTVAAHAEFGDLNAPNCHKKLFEAGVAALAQEAVEQLAPVQIEQIAS
jgi:uncharacterized protein